MIPVRYDELFQSVRNRLNTATMQRMLGGTQRIYLEGEDYSQPEDVGEVPWGRLVIRPTSTLWPEIEVPGQLLRLAILFRVEINNFVRAGYSVSFSAESVHKHIWDQLQNWEGDTYVYVKVAFPFFMHSPPQPRALFDDRRNLWWMSSVFRCQVTNP